ncbi:DUF2917 domain-containing protein [Aquabacterium sp.]|uniref:DUF2917 domain-containing protein n=1 Tax=Aquabacterium sp. TaxID=1872578 RepID=UPI002C0128A4|nr:DUF2917 domain-containing protein [Aquabacterium sp.]HSW07268.1 DUF2917 domain-containing protein [Aquabacterium sp.]
MNTLHTPLDLQPGQVLALPASTGDHWLLVLQGRIWLTQSGDTDDHFLQAGQRLLLGRHGRVVLEADGGEPARCSFQHAWAPADIADEAISGLALAEVPAPGRSLADTTAHAA